MEGPMETREALMGSTGWVEPAAEALSAPLSRGADFAELFLEDKTETRISCDGRYVSASSRTHMHGAGVYLMCGTETRYGYTNDTSPIGLSELSGSLSSLCPWATPAPVAAPLPTVEHSYPSRNAIARSPELVSSAEKAEALHDVCARARNYSAQIVEVHADYQDRIQDVAVLNSEGLLAREHRVTTTLRLFVTASDGCRSNSNWSNFTSGGGFEFLQDEATLATIVGSTCRGAVNGLISRTVSPQVMPVVVDSGTFIHEDCGHPLESTHMRDGASVFCGRLGQRVASPLVTVVDDGSLSGLCGSNAMSDEGVECSENVLIRDGILSGFMVDRLGSRELGMPMTAAGRRQDYRFAPVARMSNTYVRRGTTPTDSIIPSVSHGLYVSEVGGGNVDPTTGRFNFLAATGYLIENGELTYPISNINLSGDSIDALMRVVAVGDRYFPDSGSLCGADSGLIYVTAFMPRLLIDGLLVG
jgi:TldD protein